jgi:hypothetical protein
MRLEKAPSHMIHSLKVVQSIDTVINEVVTVQPFMNQFAIMIDIASMKPQPSLE